MRRVILRLLLAFALLSLPTLASSVHAADVASPHVSVDDVAAGFETSVRVSGLSARETVDLHVISPSGEDTAMPITADQTGAASASIPAQLTAEAGTYRVFAVRGQRKVTPEASFTVLSNRIDQRQSSLTVEHPLLRADGRAIAIVTIILRDALGNGLPGRPVQLVGSRTEDRITPLTSSRETDQTGQVQFAVQTQVPGTIALRAFDVLSGTMLEHVASIAAQAERPSVGGFSGESAFRAQVTGSESPTERAYDVLDHFTVTVSTPTVKVGDEIPRVSVTAVDARKDVVESFEGTVKISTPNDPRATLPLNQVLVFTGNRRGNYDINWLIKFKKAGIQTIVVTDESGTVRGEATVTVTGVAEISEERRIRMESPKDGDTVQGREILLKGKGPPLANLNAWVKKAQTPDEEVTDGEPTARGETQDDGTFSFTAKLPSADAVLIEIRDDETEEHDSGVIHVRVDARGPELQVTLDPAQPQEGEGVTFTVQSEPGLPEVTLAIRGQDIALTESDPGTYSALFQAPSRGDVDCVLRARDTAGNFSDEQCGFTIIGPLLPQVQNLRAQPLAGGIALEWDPIPDETITAYRIEGKAPGRDEPITLDTPEPTGSAEVHGLRAGIDYAITVRALRGAEEGPRSPMITARTLGIELFVTAQEGSLLLQWTFPDATPLASFTLEYGSPEGEYSEQRDLDGSMRAYTLKDLLTQPYLIRLTPVATTGNVLSDLAVTAEGTPSAAVAFHPSADDLPQRNLSDVSPSNALHGGAPRTTDSGLPGIPLRAVFGITAVPLGYYWYRRRKDARETRAFLRTMQQRYHS